MNIQSILSLCALIISLIALIFTFLTYRRNRLFDNANHLFKLKTELYPQIIGEYVSLINSLTNHLAEVKEYLKKEDEDQEEVIEKKADEIDILSDNFADFLVKNSLIIPSSIVNQIELFCNKIYTDATIYNSDISEDNLHQADIFLDDLIEDADKIMLALRKDLYTNELNKSLSSRLNKTSVTFKFLKKR